jgi:glycine/D-amino acid oxidase-like deaminating enzyme
MKRREFIETCAGLAVSACFPGQVIAAASRVVIVGGGIIGASIAYHLARRGAQVALLEKLRPACGATEKSFAWLNATFSKQPREYFNLNLLGMHGWRRLELELPGELAIQWGGSVEWYPAGAEAEELRREVPRHQSWGYATHFVDEAEFHRLMPAVTPGPIASASFSEQEGTLDPVQAVSVLLSAAKQAGAMVHYPCEVTGIELFGGRVRGVETACGRFESDALVLAAGVDTPRLAALAGIKVPLKDSPGVFAHTVPRPRLLERVALGPGAVIKQGPDGRIITGTSFAGTEGTDATRTRGEQLLREAGRFLPGLKDAGVDNMTLGWRVMPKDEFPIVGFADRCPNLYIAAMHSGVTLAPIVGQLVALEILDGARVDLLSPYRLSRFS